MAFASEALAQAGEPAVVWDLAPDLHDFLAVVDGRSLVLAPAARERIAQSRRLVETQLASDQPVYGLNRSLGSLKDVVMQAADLGGFNEDIWRAHAIVVSASELSVREVRALLAARVAGMICGLSGARPALVQRLVEFLNLGLHPVVRGCGLSVGESDLAPMAQIGCALLGEGEIRWRGRRLSALQALKEAGLEPYVPAAKDGLALISSNTYGSGCGLLMVQHALQMLAAANAVAALSYEGFSAHPHALSAHTLRARGFAGMHACGGVLRRLLAGGVLERAPRTLQDPLSFRCIAQVHGAVWDVCMQAARTHLTMIGGGNDSPATTPDGMQSNGNFESTGLALALDQCRLGLQRLTILATERVHKMLWNGFSGLPTALAVPGDLRNGMFLNNLSRALSATVAEISALALPSGMSATTQVTEGMDDYLSLAPVSLERLRELIPLCRRVFAIEALTAVRAIELRGHPVPAGLLALHDALRPTATMLFASGMRSVVSEWFTRFPWELAAGTGMPDIGRHWLVPPSP